MLINNLYVVSVIRILLKNKADRQTSIFYPHPENKKPNLTQI